MTTKPTEAHCATPATTPLALKSNDVLGPLPPTRHKVGIEGDGYGNDDRLTSEDAWTEDAVRAYAAAAVAEMRERCAKIAEKAVCDQHIPTGIKIYGTVAARLIRGA